MSFKLNLESVNTNDNKTINVWLLVMCPANTFCAWTNCKYLLTSSTYISPAPSSRSNCIRILRNFLWRAFLVWSFCWRGWRNTMCLPTLNTDAKSSVSFLLCLNGAVIQFTSVQNVNYIFVLLILHNQNIRRVHMVPYTN